MALHPTKTIKKSFREISSALAKKCPPSLNLIPGKKLCPTCRKAVNEAIESSSLTVTISSKETDTSTDLASDEIDLETNVQLLNQSIQSFGESPICTKKLISQSKIKKINNHIRKKLKMNIQDEEPHSKKSKEENDFMEILNQLKEKFHSTLMRSEKIQILTILPQSWSSNKIQTEFGATNYMVRCAKTLVKQKSILSTPNPQAGHPLIDSTVTLIEKFFL